MKKINKYILGALALTGCLTFSSCIDEIEPLSSVVTEKQIGSNSKAAEGLVYGIPAYENMLWSERFHNSFGLGSLMVIHDTETGDVARPGVGYNWFSTFQEVKWIDKNTAVSQMRWGISWEFMQTANNLVKSVASVENPTDTQKGYLGVGCAFRAMINLEVARSYQFMPNKALSGNNGMNDVTDYTIPIVNENTTQEEATNNPRVTWEEMFKFIESDLMRAEENIEFFDNEDKIFPDIACVHGLMARLYLWNGDYDKAKINAEKAIAETKTQPMTKDQCLSKTEGFNTLKYWMWGSQQTSESRTVQSGIVNWTSWMSPEAEFGYSNAGVQAMIDRKLYDKIEEADWRKLMYKAPEDSPLTEEFKSNLINAKAYEDIPTYASIKFRPNEGDIKTHTTGAATAYPLMRVEEMYFIKAEAAARANADEGKRILKEFMTTYRYPEYNRTELLTSQEDVINEILLQKRIELWGEGRTYFDIKRCNLSVTRGYKGTNHADASRYNTDGRPAWMNWVIVKNEEVNNKAVKGWNNPDPTGAETLWVE